jgi:hypothetical protein
LERRLGIAAGSLYEYGLLKWFTGYIQATSVAVAAAAPSFFYRENAYNAGIIYLFLPGLQKCGLRPFFFFFFFDSGSIASAYGAHWRPPSRATVTGSEAHSVTRRPPTADRRPRSNASLATLKHRLPPQQLSWIVARARLQTRMTT